MDLVEDCRGHLLVRAEDDVCYARISGHDPAVPSAQ
jgi:hypothetical protein